QPAPRERDSIWRRRAVRWNPGAGGVVVGGGAVVSKGAVGFFRAATKVHLVPGRGDDRMSSACIRTVRSVLPDFLFPALRFGNANSGKVLSRVAVVASHPIRIWHAWFEPALHECHSGSDAWTGRTME